MPLGLHNPLPSSMSSECRKAGKILASFVDPRQAFGPDKVIPPQILANAKGLAILTVIKAGFLGSARGGSGIVVARLPDGSWSAPSAIATGGAGFGGQIGFEITDFVFILNDPKAVESFSQQGSITLGGNVSIAAGPVGRNAEAAGAASMKGVAAVFTYSKTKGLFAGVSVEGSAMIERRDANEKLYNSRVTAKQLLSGMIPPPPAADPLMRVLNSKIFAGIASNADPTGMYNDVPVYDDNHENLSWEGRQSGAAAGNGIRRDRASSSGLSRPPQRASTWKDDVYDSAPPVSPVSGISRASTMRTMSSGPRSPISFNPTSRFEADSKHVSPHHGYSDHPPPKAGGSTSKPMSPGRPTAPKPKFGFGDNKESLRENQAIALFSFDAAQEGDLAFRKGEVIDIVKRTESTNDWWTGRIGDREGIFPSNYVEVP